MISATDLITRPPLLDSARSRSTLTGMGETDRAVRERRIQQIAAEIERQGGDSDGLAAEFLLAMIAQSPREGTKTMQALAGEVEAWRRARRTARRLFSNLAPAKR